MGRAAILTALAQGAGVGIEDILPCQLFNLAGTEALRLLIFQVESDQLAGRAKIGEQVIGAGGQDVAQLAEGDDGDKAGNQQQVQPPGGAMQRAQRGLAITGNGIGDQ